MTEQVDPKPWTYTSDIGTYDVSKFTDEGKTAFLILLETDKDLQALKKQTAKLNRAIVGFNQDIAEQLTDEMLVEEEPVTQYMDELVEEEEPTTKEI
tara:strand:+ start:793 stop:1083 length:291 start_codon:yes stop_codon:yes gene_type:complete